MGVPEFRFFCCLALAMISVQGAIGQQAPSRDELAVYLGSCKINQNHLNVRPPNAVPVNDTTSAIGKACDKLKVAISNSDAAQIEASERTLRPLLALRALPPTTPQERLAATEKETSGALNEYFDNLPDLAKLALKVGESAKADSYARQLLLMAPEFPREWNYGNAIFYGNLVLGRIALQKGNVPEASRYLLAAGATPGSPQLNTFGPEMTLAKELLEKGESEVVSQYLALCKNFWKMDYGKLDEWNVTVRGGGIPDFTSFP